MRAEVVAASVVVLSSSFAALPTDARAVEGEDTSYGRIDGDLSGSAGVGATFGPRGPRASVDLRLRYLWHAGVFATYEDGPLFGSAAEPRRAFATGVEMRPFFIVRWLQGLQSGNAYLDMTIDSLALELGAVFLQPAGSKFGSKPGLQLGVGMEIPVLPRATGPVIGVHGGVRWSDSALGGQVLEGPSDRAMYLLVSLAWQQVFGTQVVDLGDRAPR